MFVNWRRGLAKLEEEEKLVLTPFEKNLEVWRQLWRVLERSDIVVQERNAACMHSRHVNKNGSKGLGDLNGRVVDARDPLLYRSTDLEGYARDLHASKTSLVLLNKADLLPVEVREAWADYFDKRVLQIMPAEKCCREVLQRRPQRKAPESLLHMCMSHAHMMSTLYGQALCLISGQATKMY
eukprot:1141866-Pelagomonas_calceolata.AAC.6